MTVQYNLAGSIEKSVFVRHTRELDLVSLMHIIFFCQVDKHAQLKAQIHLFYCVCVCVYML